MALSLGIQWISNRVLVENYGLFGLPSIPLFFPWCRSQCIMRLEGRDLFIDSTILNIGIKSRFPFNSAAKP